MRRLGCLLVVLAGCGPPPEPVSVSRLAPEERVERSGAPAPSPEERQARESRRTRVRHDADAIRSECERAAGGDWRKWEDETARYRGALKPRLAALKRLNLANSELLAGRDLPIFQVNAQTALAHVVDPGHWDAFRKTRAVAAASRWLRERGIDLNFIAVPSMPEVYVEQFLDDTPPDGVIAPHVRQTFLELLESDVEVVDTFRPMREARARGFLYLPADHHWNQLGMRATVRDVAERLSRYPFGQEAKRAAPVTKTESGPYVLPPTENGTPWRPFGSAAISDSQWQSALGTLPRTMDRITSPDGSPVPDDPRSPVMLIGNSFAMQFRELLIREANLRLRTRWGNGSTTDAFPGFLREPEALDGVRVIVWVTDNEALAQFRPLPAAIMETLRDAERE